jgi:hypothetical protein
MAVGEVEEIGAGEGEREASMPKHLMHLTEREREQRLTLQRLFAEQEHGLRGCGCGHHRHPSSVSESRRARRSDGGFGSDGARWRSLHQLDAVAAGGDREGAGLAPVLAAAFDLEAVLLEAGEGAVDLRADDSDVGAGWDDRVVLVHEVDLGAGALDPGEAAVEGVRDDGEAKDREELEGPIEIGGSHLDAGVLEHSRLGVPVGHCCQALRTGVRLMPRRPRSPSTR